MASLSYAFTDMRRRHAGPVIAILNHYIENGFSAFYDELVSTEHFPRLLEAIGKYPSSVATVDSGEMVGFAFLRPFNPAPAFRRTAEITYFIHPGHTRKGLGGILLDVMIMGAADAGVDNLVAAISSLNPQSIAFHAKHKFKLRGRIPAAGVRRGQEFDLVYMSRRI